MTFAIHADDYRDYLSRDGLVSVSGVEMEYHISLIIKEIVDNALDASGHCDLSMGGDNQVCAHDPGEGIPGTDEEIAYLFSVVRRTFSTKGERYPRRGAMGRGLRFVAGAAFCYGITLSVSTRGRTLLLKPGDGNTLFERIGDFNGKGTLIALTFPTDIKESELQWGRLAIRMSNGASYNGYSSPLWYDTGSFYVLLKSIEYGSHSVIQAIRQLFGGRYGLKDFDLTIRGILNKKTTDDLSMDDARLILYGLRRSRKKDVNPKKLGYVGKLNDFPSYYKKGGYFEHTSYDNGRETVEIPYIVELWAKKDDKKSVTILVNKTPIAMPIKKIYADMIYLSNVNLDVSLQKTARKFSLLLNIITPFLPRTGNAKIPKFPKEINTTIENVCNKMIKKINREKDFAGESKQKNVKLEDLAEPIQANAKKIQRDSRQSIDSFCRDEGLLKEKSRYLNVLTYDPFLVGNTFHTATKAAWFEYIWKLLNIEGKIIHLRRLHYIMVSQETTFYKHDKRKYVNDYDSWQYLVMAAKFARELGLVDPLLIADKRNPLPYGDLVVSFDYHKDIIFPDWVMPKLEIADLKIDDLIMPELSVDEIMARRNISALQPVHVEIWTEKATMNDILIDICESYGTILVQNAGYSSITAVERFLKERAMLVDKPSVILYISDYDEAGENMPVMVSRTLQHRITKLKEQKRKNIEVAVHPIILTKEQMHNSEFSRLPKAPSKNGKKKVTELDALEAIMPGKFREIVEYNLRRFLDMSLIYNLQSSIKSAREKYQSTLEPRISDLATQGEKERRNAIEIIEKYKPQLQQITDSLSEELLTHYKKIQEIRESIIKQAKKLLDETEIKLTTEKQPPLDEALFFSVRPFKEQTKMLLDYRSFREPDQKN